MGIVADGVGSIGRHVLQLTELGCLFELAKHPGSCPRLPRSAWMKMRTGVLGGANVERVVRDGGRRLDRFPQIILRKNGSASPGCSTVTTPLVEAT